jgi:peptidoglycan/LPS O-acetylase OafA/YrhL
MESNIQADRYQELDALRGIAALMVVLFHFTYETYISQLGFKLGSTGVDLFFMISGFVIFRSLNKVKSSKEFIINRVSRLYPTYWTCVSFAFLIISLYAFYKHESIPLLQYLANMTMFQYYLKQPNLDGPYWTMIIEMIFYIAILLLFHFKKIKYVNQIALSIIIATALFVSVLHSAFVKTLTEVIPLLQFLPLFFSGIVFYTIFLQKNRLYLNYSILFICYVCQILFFVDFERSFITQMEYALMLTLYFFLFILFVHGKLKFIVSKTTLFLGKISFALYLIHQCITARFIIPICINRFHINLWIIIFFIALPVAIGLATLVTYYIDVPLSFRMKQKLRTMLSLK